MGKHKSKAAAKENNGSEKRVTKKTSKTAENLEAEAFQKRMCQETRNDRTLLENEFEEAGTIGDPTEPVNPRYSDDEKEEETRRSKFTGTDTITI